MTIPQIKVIDVTTGEEIVRDATAAEISQIEIDIANYKAKEVEAEAKAQARAELLNRLGISEEEARLLLS